MNYVEKKKSFYSSDINDLSFYLCKKRVIEYDGSFLLLVNPYQFGVSCYFNLIFKRAGWLFYVQRKQDISVWSRKLSIKSGLSELLPFQKEWWPVFLVCFWMELGSILFIFVITCVIFPFHLFVFYYHNNLFTCRFNHNFNERTLLEKVATKIIFSFQKKRCFEGFEKINTLIDKI